MVYLTPWLLLALLLLPTGGALLARLAGRWFGPRIVQIIGGAGFVGAVICLLVLRWMPQDAAALGRLSIFLPSQDVVVERDAFLDMPTALVVVQIEPTATLRPTTRPTAAPTPTQAPTLTALPTEPPPPTEAPPTDVPPPTEAPPAPTAPPPAPTAAPARTGAVRYVVKSGDTLRGIAERFDVSVEALLRYNGLTPEEGDSLQVGQELFVPPQ